MSECCYTWLRFEILSDALWAYSLWVNLFCGDSEARLRFSGAVRWLTRLCGHPPIWQGGRSREGQWLNSWRFAESTAGENICSIFAILGIIQKRCDEYVDNSVVTMARGVLLPRVAIPKTSNACASRRVSSDSRSNRGLFP